MSQIISSITKLVSAFDFEGHLGDRVQRPMKETQENQQNAETQRERYYATIHKVALQQAANASGTDKIPGENLSRSVVLTDAVFENIFSTIENRVLRLSFTYKIRF